MNLKSEPICSYRCEQVCEGWHTGNNCNESLCYGTDIFWAIWFGVLTILLLIRLFQFYRNNLRPYFTLKKLIFIFGALGTFIRFLRFALMAGNALHRTVYVQLLYAWSLNCMFLIFTLLLMFWANLIRKGHIPFKWLGKRMALYFIAINVIQLILYTIIAILQDIFPTGTGFRGRVVNNVANLLALIVLVSVAIAALFEGFKLISILKKSGGEGYRDLALVRKISLISISTAAAQLVLCLHVIIVGIMNTARSWDYVQCHVTHIVFNFLYTGAIGVILVPMADFRVEKPPSHTPEKDNSNSAKNKRQTTPQAQNTATTTSTENVVGVHGDLTTSTVTLSNSMALDAQPEISKEEGKREDVSNSLIEDQEASASSTPSNEENLSGKTDLEPDEKDAV